MIAIQLKHKAVDDATAQCILEEFSRCKSEAVRDQTRVELQQLLDLHPGVLHTPVLLDAAADIAINSMVDRGVQLPLAIETLADKYPDISDAVNRAGCLSLVFSVLVQNNQDPVELPQGQRLGPPDRDGRPRYEIVEICGRGCGAVVYRVIDHRMSDSRHTSFAAVKILSDQKHINSTNPSEAVIAGSVAHPNVVSVYDCGVSQDGNQYYAMELSEIGSLSALSEVGTNAHVRMVRDLAFGLHATHSVGIVHGDIKPDNVLLFGNDDEPHGLVPKLADFGIARSLNLGHSSPDDNDSMPAGNLAFMAPEVWSGAHPSIQSDVYALAAMLRFLVSGETSHAPHLELNDTVATSIGIPDRLVQLLDRATRVDPALRPSSAAEFANDLDAWLSGDSIEGIDSVVTRGCLCIKRHPAVSSILVASFLAITMVSIGAVYSWKGWVYESAHRAAASNVADWHDRYRPAFSDRASVYDLAARFALAQSLEQDDAFEWAVTLAPDLENNIEQLNSILKSLPPASIDVLLVREQLIFHQLQSKQSYQDTYELIQNQRIDLDDSGFLTPEEQEQIKVFEAVRATKEAVLSKTPEEIDRGMLGGHLKILLAFLEARGLATESGLSDSARRDPRVRLAARAAHWLSSPKILGVDSQHRLLDAEYGLFDHNAD